jgi:hypothetical protein
VHTLLPALPPCLGGQHREQDHALTSQSFLTRAAGCENIELNKPPAARGQGGSDGGGTTQCRRLVSVGHDFPPNKGCLVMFRAHRWSPSAAAFVAATSFLCDPLSHERCVAGACCPGSGRHAAQEPHTDTTQSRAQIHCRSCRSRLCGCMRTVPVCILLAGVTSRRRPADPSAFVREAANSAASASVTAAVKAAATSAVVPHGVPPCCGWINT